MNSATLGNLIPGLTRGTDYVPLDCQRCPLAVTRTQVVPGEGARRPTAVFVGEAPGPDEDRLGRPFIGRAGKILREALRDAGWRSDEIWITNTVKCFPFDVEDEKKRIRAPKPAESKACRGHLEAELHALRPGLIVALGRSAVTALTGDDGIALDADHGAVRETPLGRVFVTFHPSGLHYRTGRSQEFLEDLRKARVLATENAAR